MYAADPEAENRRAVLAQSGCQLFHCAYKMPPITRLQTASTKSGDEHTPEDMAESLRREKKERREIRQSVSMRSPAFEVGGHLRWHVNVGYSPTLRPTPSEIMSQ